MLKITNLVELMDIADVELQHDIPDGTLFKYKNNCYVVKRVLEKVDKICSQYCDLREDFDDDIEKSEVNIDSCGSNCPFGWHSAAVKLSEIEALVLLGDKND